MAMWGDHSVKLNLCYITLQSLAQLGILSMEASRSEDTTFNMIFQHNALICISIWQSPHSHQLLWLRIYVLLVLAFNPKTKDIIVIY